MSLGVGYATGDASAGKAVYDSKCKICYGPRGEGNPGHRECHESRVAEPGVAEAQKVSDDELKKIITEGKGTVRR
jgi:cytochrome c